MNDFAPTVRLVADDALGERVLARLRRRVCVPPSPGEIDVEVRVGTAPTVPRSPVLAVMAGERLEALPGVVALSGDEEWLVAAIAAILDVALLSGRVSIDLADLRAVFAGRGPARGSSARLRASTMRLAT